MLNNLEQAFVQRFVEEDGMALAVKNAIMEHIRNSIPTDMSGDNEMLGQKLRAYDTAKKLINDSFLAIEEYKGRGKITNQNNLER